MHGMITSIRERLGLLAAITGLVAIIGLMPMFGSTAYAAGLNLDGTVSRSEFLIPNGPITLTTAALNNTDQAPLTLSTGDTSSFPAMGQVLVDHTELMTYTSKTSTSFNITERNPDKNSPAPKKTLAAGSLVQLATQLTASLTGSPAHTTLETTVGETEPMSFPISVGSDANFGTSGFLTISHSDTDAGGVSGEYFQYNRSCGSGSQLCLTARQLNANNVASNHPKDGYAQPGGTPGQSFVDKHSTIAVKSIDGFFPTGDLMIFTVDSGGAIVGAELAARVLGDAAAKLTAVGANEMTISTRGGRKATFDSTTVSAHAAGSVVISAATQLTCRAKSESPIPAEPGAQSPTGSSVGTFSVCYTR